MNTVSYRRHFEPQKYESRAFRWSTAALVSVAMCVPLSAARADDDDWEDRWEDYQEELEDRREEARERWEDEQEAYEEWREDRREAWEDRRERRIVVPRYGRRQYVRPQEYWEEPLPPPQYYYEDRGPVYREYYYSDRPPVYREYRTYRPYGPEYRYYGTPRVGYSEYGPQRSVRVGPFRVYWRR